LLDDGWLQDYKKEEEEDCSKHYVTSLTTDKFPLQIRVLYSIANGCRSDYVGSINKRFIYFPQLSLEEGEGGKSTYIYMCIWA